MSQFTPPIQPGAMGFRPHRGTLILVLGILSLVIGCVGWIMGIMAWVMGSADLRAMDAGLMDPSGRGLTQAGKICGIIGTLLQLLGVACVVLWLVVVVGGAIAAGAAAGHP